MTKLIIWILWLQRKKKLIDDRVDENPSGVTANYARINKTLPLLKSGRAGLNQSQIRLRLCFVQEEDSGGASHACFLHCRFQFRSVNEFLSVFQRIPLVDNG